MRDVLRFLGLCVVAPLMLIATQGDSGVSPTPDGGAPAQGLHRLESVPMARFDGSVLDLPQVPVEVPAEIEGLPRRQQPAAAPTQTASDFLDPMVQTTADPIATSVTLPLLNFDGLSTAVHPQDSVGDAGPGHYVQMGNGSSGGAAVGIWDKSGGFLASFKMGDLWSGVGGPCVAGLGDGVVLHDEAADRWLLAQVASTFDRLCFAVSQGPDPTGSYYLYAFFTAGGNYLKVGIWPDSANDGYFASTNLATSIWYAVFERPKMLMGDVSANGFGTSGFPKLPGQGLAILMPADLDGPPPPPGSPGYYYRQVDGDLYGGADRIELFESTIDWTGPSGALTGPLSIPVSPFDSTLCGPASTSCIPQSGGPALDPLSEVPMWRLQYRNFGTHETLVGSFSVDSDGADTAGVRWFELRKSGGGSWALHQEGTYAPQDGGFAEHRWMGSAAMDAEGNIAIGYSLSSAATVPQIRYAGRCAGDASGSLPRGEHSIHPGGIAEDTTRWGDYSSLIVDPTDGTTFWYTNDYVRPGTIRQSRIASFTLNCAGDLVCGDGIVTPPETCDPPVPASCNCCVTHPGTGCTDAACETAICGADSFCCTTAWDQICADAAASDPSCGCCTVTCDTYCGVCGDGVVTPPETCDPPSSGPCNCCVEHAGTGCTDPACESAVCSFDSFCCNTVWDSICAGEAASDPSCGCCEAVPCEDYCGVCGDGAVTPPEECDDGNTVPGDGCGAACLVECGNGIVDPNETCDPPGPIGSDCCEAGIAPGCSDSTCEATICGVDPFCCGTQWDGTCAAAALLDPQCAASCLGAPADAPYSGDCCDVRLGQLGCSDPTCEAAVCGADTFCCATEWDGLCAAAAVNTFPVECAPNCLPLLSECGPQCTFCGDGAIDPGEACDDDNAELGDGCRPDCTAELCGDSILDPGEECEPPGSTVSASDCCEDNGTPTCSMPGCSALVCAADPFCCNVTWDSVCAAAAQAAGCCPGVCQEQSCCVDTDGDGTCDTTDSCVATPNPEGTSDCCIANGSPGCSDPLCQATICAFDSYCCDTEWDGICASEALRDPGCLAGCGGAIFNQTLLAADESTFVWPAAANVVWVRGDLASLSMYATVAVVTASGATTIPAPEIPSSGQALWWLVKADCPGGSWSSGGAGECAGAGCTFGNRDFNLP